VAVAAAATRAARAVVARAMGWVVDTGGRLAVAEAGAVEVETMAGGLGG